MQSTTLLQRERPQLLQLSVALAPGPASCIARPTHSHKAWLGLPFQVAGSNVMLCGYGCVFLTVCQRCIIACNCKINGSKDTTACHFSLKATVLFTFGQDF